MAKWMIIALTQEAKDDLAILFQNDDVRDEVKRILKLLALQTAPDIPHRQ